MIRKGDLVSLPSEALLVQFTDEVSIPFPAAANYKTINKPASVLVIDDIKRDEKYYKILHKGEKWYVHEKDIHKTI